MKKHNFWLFPSISSTESPVQRWFYHFFSTPHEFVDRSLVDRDPLCHSPKARKYWPITIACGVVCLGLFRATEHIGALLYLLLYWACLVKRLCVFGKIAWADNLPGVLHIAGASCETLVYQPQTIAIFVGKSSFVWVKYASLCHIHLVPGHCPQ